MFYQAQRLHKIKIKPTIKPQDRAETSQTLGYEDPEYVCECVGESLNEWKANLSQPLALVSCTIEAPGDGNAD